jgi:hypothetical protein
VRYAAPANVEHMGHEDGACECRRVEYGLPAKYPVNVEEKSQQDEGGNALHDPFSANKGSSEVLHLSIVKKARVHSYLDITTTSTVDRRMHVMMAGTYLDITTTSTVVLRMHVMMAGTYLDITTTSTVVRRMHVMMAGTYLDITTTSTVVLRMHVMAGT